MNTTHATHSSADTLKRRLDHLDETQLQTLSAVLSVIRRSTDQENDALHRAVVAFYLLSDEGKEAAAAHLSHMVAAWNAGSRATCREGGEDA